MLASIFMIIVVHTRTVKSSARLCELCVKHSLFHAALAKPAEKRAQDETMIVEVRSYRITPGKRDEFIEFFETRSIKALQSHGMKVVGPMVDVENPNKFVFLRGFPTMADLHRMKDEFYGGKLWKEELEQIAMPMIESYDVILCETTTGFVMDDLREEKK